MSFLAIFILVLVVLIVLCVVFALLKFLFWLLPLAIIAAAIIWLIYYFSNRDHHDPNKSGTGRKRPKNVSVKDIKD